MTPIRLRTSRGRRRAPTLVGMIGALVLLSATVALPAASASPAAGPTADLTRFGPQQYQRASGPPTSTVSSFVATSGPGVITVTGSAPATVSLNGAVVLRKQPREDRISAPVTLAAANSLAVRLTGRPGTAVRLRVTQRVAIPDLHITAVFHVGINVRNFQQQQAFYQALGFQSAINPAGPPTNTPEVTGTQGVPSYLLAGVSLNSLNAQYAPPYLDTVQYLQPYRDDPPYASPNHLGIAYVTYGTTNLDAAVAYLKNAGISFVSAPATTVTGQRFAIFKDPQGTFFRLVQDPGAPSGALGAADLTAFEQVGINVSDMQRSVQFYKLLGFSGSTNTSEAGAGPAARAWGQDGAYAFSGRDLSLPGSTGPSVELQRWLHPYDPAPPYPLPVNHLGIDRMDLATSDLLATVAGLRALGIPEVGTIAPCCSGPQSPFGIAMFQDPDGNNIEVSGPIIH